MHLEILVEELSAKYALENLLPRLVLNEHTYRIITYQGKMDMLKKLPVVLKGYSKSIFQDMKIIILIDLDNDNCIELKRQLESYTENAKLISISMNKKRFHVLNRIAVHELESWFLGDFDAIKISYPKVKRLPKKNIYFNPDSIVNAWETLEKILQSKGYYLNGIRKLETSTNISKNMNPLQNKSKSFQVFWSGLVACLSS